MRSPRITRTKVALLVIVAGALALVGYAFAAPGFGPQYRGTLVQRINAHSDGVHMHTHGSTDLIAQDIVLHPGDNSGWHYHPGVVLISVSGPPGNHLLFHDVCHVITIPVDQPPAVSHAFYETGHHPGLVESPSTNTDNITLHVMYVLPTGAPPRINTDPPHCN
jgi:hypothetical protein